MRNYFDLSGKVAIVTGSSRGLGQEMARALAEAGANIVLTSRNPERLNEIANEIENIGRQYLKVKLDVTKNNDIKNMIKKTYEKFGKIDILVNNAGCITRNLALKISEEDWDYILDTNLKGTFFCSQAAAKVMRTQKSGRIINIGSATCVFGTAGVIPYGASRGGLLQLTKGLAVEWGSYGITVNMLAPGWFKTDQTKELFKNKRWNNSVIERIPLGRTGKKQDLNGPIVFLASDASNYVTGQVIFIDGGYTVSAIKASS